jgi:hypothetical protein
MDRAIAFHGLLGLFILFATMIVLAVMILIVTGVYLVGRSSGSRMKKHLLFPAVMLLIFDAFVYLSMIMAQDTVWRKDEAMLFDERMLYIWIPSHVVGYVLLAVIFYYVGTRKAEINGFVDKLR